MAKEKTYRIVMSYETYSVSHGMKSKKMTVARGLLSIDAALDEMERLTGKREMSCSANGSIYPSHYQIK